MRPTRHPLLVALAVLVGVTAAYVTIELYAHAAATPGRDRARWLAGAVAIAALGTWSVHFVGMLSLRLWLGASLVPIEHHIPRMLLPLAVMATAVGLATSILERYHVQPVPRVAAGLLGGAGVVCAHYAAISAVRLPGVITHRPVLVLASVLIAEGGGVVVSTVATSRWWRTGRGALYRLGLSCLAAGTATATHYTAIAAARFTPSGQAMPIGEQFLLATNGVAIAVAVSVLIALGMALLVLTVDRRARAERSAAEHLAHLYRDAEAARTRAEESERRFRMLADTGPAMVWLADPHGRRAFVGQKWAEFTGRPEGTGADWGAVIAPEDRDRCLAEYHAAIEARERFRLEYRVRRPDGTQCWVLDTGVPRESSAAEFLGYVGTCVDITARREAEDAQAYLLEVARVLATSLDLDAVLRHVVDLLVPRLADYCMVYLGTRDAPYRQVTATHRDPSKVPLLDELERRYRPVVGRPHSPVGRALRTLEPVLVPNFTADAVRTMTDDPEALRIVRELAPTAYLVLPLVAHGELLGALTLAMSTSGRSFGERDAAHAELFAARAALAIDNARLYTEARRAQEEMLRASQLESQLMRTRLQALRAQLNPHFLFNALNTIAMLVRRQANQDALHGIVSLSDLLRRSLTKHDALQEPLRAELPLLESYIAIEQLRFRDRLRVEIDIAPDTLDALVPTLLLQPLVENSIKHGVARRGEAGIVEVHSRREGETLVLEVCDDGPGFPPGWDPTSSGGVGLANTRERLERLYGSAHRFEARDRNGSGAVVTVRIPFQVAPSEPRR